jgi:ubiquinone/menaquinone biosynthesis C-methylase UbiE
MLERTRPRLDGEGVSNCRVIEGDAYNIVALAGAPADMVIMAITFHGVPDKARLGHAIASVLKPGGRFIVVNWREETMALGRPRGPKTEMRMEPEDVAASVGSSGLSLTDVVELPPYHYAAVLQRITE